MNIGIDFDNTIVKYDNLFKEVAITEGFIKENWNGNGKTVLRNYLRRQPDGETTWMKLQGLVYGKYMLGAEMMPGVANFFMTCNERDHRIFIVSHKTEYGHFDPEKISLRVEALKWMKMRRIFDPEYFGIKQEDVFFADTREEKVNMIARLNCDWFIDDLPEVFDEKHFPASTNKILFGLYKFEQYKDRTVRNTWIIISKKILGQQTGRDIIFWTRGLSNEAIGHAEKIRGRGNSTVYRIHTIGGISYALKYYPDRRMDDRPRLETEFQTLGMLHEHGLKNVPRTIKKNIDLSLGLYEWIEGKKISIPTDDDLDQVIAFTEKLVGLSKEMDGKTLGMASEACFSARELTRQIEKRFLRLQKVSMNFQDLSRFLNDVFTPLWKQVKDESISLWPKESRMKDLPRKKQTLSPSDLGFHNCLKASNGSLTFLDFDYFGWDDPVKLTADFIWHPAMKLNIELKEKWRAAMLKLHSGDQYFEERLNAAMPLFGMRWALIVLNEFFPELAQKRRDADGSEQYDLDKFRVIQLKKSEDYCGKVKVMFSQVTIA